MKRFWKQGMAVGLVLPALGAGACGRNDPGSAARAELKGSAAAAADGAGGTDSGGDAPLKAQLDARRRDVVAKMAPDQLRIHEEGIAAVRNTGIEGVASHGGDRAADFTLPSTTGENVTLSELLRSGPVVLTWYRGGWCPYCAITLSALQEQALPEIEKLGGRLVAITPELPEKARETAERLNLTFPILSDRGNRIADAYGIRFTLPAEVAEAYKAAFNLAEYNGDDSYELPLAATYVIGTDGEIHWAFIDADYRNRAEPGRIIAALAGLVTPE